MPCNDGYDRLDEESRLGGFLCAVMTELLKEKSDIETNQQLFDYLGKVEAEHKCGEGNELYNWYKRHVQSDDARIDAMINKLSLHEIRIMMERLERFKTEDIGCTIPLTLDQFTPNESEIRYQLDVKGRYDGRLSYEFEGLVIETVGQYWDVVMLGKKSGRKVLYRGYLAPSYAIEYLNNNIGNGRIKFNNKNI